MLVSSNPESGSFKSRLAESYVAETENYGVMPRHMPTWPLGNAESKRKIALISAAFLSIRSTEVCGIFGQTSAPILYLGVRTCEIFLYIVPFIDYIDYYVPRLYFLRYSRVLQFLQEDEPKILRFPVIRKSREASVRFLRPNPSPLARPWPSTLAISRMKTCLQNLAASSGYCRWWGLRIFS